VTNTAEGTTAHVVVWNDGEVMLTLTFDPRVGPSPAAVDALVADTHRLDRTHWEQLLQEGNGCLLTGRGGAASGSGTDQSSGTSSTTAVTPTSVAP
jgi:hypothetical protein